MIPKYLRGASFHALIRYLVHAPGRGGLPRQGATVLGVQGVLGIDTAAIEMTAVARRSERVRKPVVHLSVSLSPSEQLDDRRWCAVIGRAERELGLEGHQRVVVRHDDADHSHVHVAWNAIHPETSHTPSAHWDRHAKWRLSALCRVLEQEMGLCTPERARARPLQPAQVAPVPTSTPPDLIRVSAGQEARERRTGEPSLADTHGTRIKAALRRSTWDERAAELARLGLRISLYSNPDNPRRRGLVIADLVDAGRRCIGSDLGSDYALGAIERRSAETLDRWVSRQSTQPQMAAASAPQTFDQDRVRLWEEYLRSRKDHRARRDDLRRKRKQHNHEHRLQRTAQRVSQRVRRRHIWRAKDGLGMRWLIRQIADWREGEERRALLTLQRREREEFIRVSGTAAAPEWSDFLTRQATAGDDGAARVLARMKGRKRPASDRLHESAASDARTTAQRVECIQTQAGAPPVHRICEIPALTPPRSGVPSCEQRSATGDRENMFSRPAPDHLAGSNVRSQSPRVSPRSRGGRGKGAGVER